MSTYKRVNGNLIIENTSVGGSYTGNITLNTDTVQINGNLDVLGNLTYIETTELKVDDPFITVAGNNTGNIANAVFQGQGLVTQTSSSTFAGLRFYNNTLTWQISPSVDANGAPIVAYSDLASVSGSSPGGPELAIQINVGNTFYGNSSLTYDYSNSSLILNGYQAFGNIVTAPTITANSVNLYHNAVGTGGTGLYFNSSSGSDELISKTKAITFSLVF